MQAMDPSTRRRIHRLTTAVRDFRRISSSTAFASRWLGAGADALEGGQYDVLDRLSEKEGWRMGEIAAALRVDPSATTRAVPPLEQMGFVERTRDPNDGRAVLVRITDEGRERQERARSQGLQLWDEALQEFTDDELEEFAVLMRRLAGSFERLLFGSTPTEEHPEVPADATADTRSTSAEESEPDLKEVVRRLAVLESRI
jgi:DNA-binding MarR family transcriptional regulator